MSIFLGPSFVFGVPLAVVTALLIAAVVFGVRRSRAIVFDEARYPGLAKLRRATLRSRSLGIVLGLVVFVVVSGLGRYDQWVFVAPAAGGAVVIGAILAGQRLTYTQARTQGVAGLERRELADYLPARQAVTSAGLLLVLAVVGAWAAFVATSDASGLARGFTHVCVEQLWDGQGYHEQVVTSVSTPFPGSYYTVGMAVAIVVLLGLAWVGLVATTRRPRNGSDAELVRVDDALRRQTTEGTVAGFGLAVAATLAGLSYAAALMVGKQACTDAYGLGSWALALVAAVAFAFALWFAVIVLVPGDWSRKRS